MDTQLARTFTFDKPICSDELIRLAKQELATTILDAPIMKSPQAVRDFLLLEFSGEETEQFYCMFLNAAFYVTDARVLFRGTIDSAAVYPREVVRAAIDHNAKAVIFAHNQPSGVAEPRQCDRRITERLQKALALIDVTILDHFVIGGTDIVSFQESGWL